MKGDLKIMKLVIIEPMGVEQEKLLSMAQEALPEDLETVLGITFPLRILPKGTHIYSPSILGSTGSLGTPFRVVILSTSR